MKTNFFSAIILIGLFACNPASENKERTTEPEEQVVEQLPPSLVGSWEHTFENGDKFRIDVGADSSTQTYTNDTAFMKGKYYVVNDTLHVEEPLGLGYFATYKLDFITPDSLRLLLVEDKNPGRAEATPNLRLRRLP